MAISPRRAAILAGSKIIAEATLGKQARDKERQRSLLEESRRLKKSEKIVR